MLHHQGSRARLDFRAPAACLTLAALALLGPVHGDRMSIHPDAPNTITVEAQVTRFVRLVIRSSSAAEPCIDELEVHGPASEANLALAESGAVASASSCLPGYTSHQIVHLNDGLYGNDHSWIAATQGTEWAQIELSEPAEVDRIIISRDRARQYADRIPASFDVQFSDDGQSWRTVRSITDVRFVHPEMMLLNPNRPIELTFDAWEAKSVRIQIYTTSSAPPCIDEFEVFAEDSDENLALADGATASASSCLPGHAIHQIEHLNDGQYTNAHSWIAETIEAWAQIDLPQTETIQRVVFSRDRDGSYRDRLPTDFEVQVSMDGEEWQTVKHVVAMQNVPIEQAYAGELVADWALRVADALTGELHEEALALASEAEEESDVEPILALHTLDRDRRAMQRRLDVELNVEAFRRAMDDQSQAGAAVPEDADAWPGDVQAQSQAIRQGLDAGGSDAIREALVDAEALLQRKRAIMLANPLLDFDEILLLKRKAPEARPGDVYWEWGQAYGMTVNWSCDFRPKNPPIAPWWDDELVALSLDSGDLRSIYKPQPTFMLQQPELDFDARHILFAMADSEGAFQVWEMGVDGADPRQITHDTGPDIDNGDACYLPDGRIVFNSTRAFTGVPCEDGMSYVSTLCLTDADGDETRMLTFDQESNWHPSVLNDGRVLYTRYEYANVSHQFGRLLFHMNPDGTEQREYYGSNSYWPNSVFYARPIPNDPSMVVGVVCGHHGPNKTGPLVLFDPTKGRRETSGAVQMIPGYGKPVERVVEDELYQGVWPKFAHPWPLSDKYFLAAARPTPDQPEYALYLVDVFDNVTEICKLPGYSLFEPIPITARQRPPVVPDRVDLASDSATVFLSDVYQGSALEGAPRGSVRKLRLFTYNYVYRETLNRGFGHLATTGVDGPWEPRHILGTVPVNEDGSALFTVPANTPISLQPLDEKGRALQQMRSWFTAMPGETVSCVGCHEPQNTSPPANLATVPNATPAEITPWRGPRRGFDFELEVQPVLDRFCVGCHDGAQANGLDFSRKTEEEKLAINAAHHQATASTITTTLTPSFIAIHPYVRRPHAESNYGPQVAGEYFATTSPLVKLLEKGHHGVRLDEEGWDRLYTWIDLGAPDHGSWKYSEWGVERDYYERRLEMLAHYAGRTDDVELLPEGPATVREFVPPPSAAPNHVPTVEGWPFDGDQARRMQSETGLPESTELTTDSGVTLKLALIPAGKFVMGAAGGAEDEGPPNVVTIDHPFYMATTEVSNAQVAGLPGSNAHNSGIEGWRSIDWRGEGYGLNAPDQPAVRMSWKDAVAFCDALSEATGRTVSLPTEAQWEWACRAGSDSPLWYGDADTDFGALENLAGREQLGFAFSGKRQWHMRDDRFDDGSMVTAPVGSYQPNAWALHDMAGNVAEWTRSAYVPYPYRDDDGRNGEDLAVDRVVRGGSWFERQASARSAFRWHYPSWLKVHDVGFRVVVEAE